MKRVATKEDVIAATRELIAQRGIRAIGVDQIAELLGMSKRTLYQMFECKGTLMNACFERMSCQQQEKIRRQKALAEDNSLSYLLLLSAEYVTGLYHVDISFLEDVSQMSMLYEHYEKCRTLWQQEMTRALTQCLLEEYLLPQINPSVFASQILNTFFELRIRRLSTLDDDLMLLQTIIRGASTTKGLNLLDR